MTFSVVPAYAQVGTYEYNDFNLYSTGGTRYTSNAFRSNNSSLTSFVITLNVYDNTWYITGGTSTAIPFPTGVEIDYTDRTTFLTSAYYTVNGTQYSFTYVSADDTSGNFYSRSITTSGYPVVNVYLPTTGTSTAVPTTPILSVSQLTDNANWLEWTPTGYSTRILYSETGTGEYTTLTDVGTTPWKNNYATGYYRVQLHYTVDGVDRVTDTSNRVYCEMLDDSSSGDEEESNWQKLLRFFDNIITGIQNATSTIGQFIGTLREFITTLFSWLPEELTAVFIAILIVGLVIGLFLK